MARAFPSLRPRERDQVRRVVHRNAQGNRAYAVRSIWSQPGASAYASAAWLKDAAGWQDFRNAADRWGGPLLARAPQLDGSALSAPEAPA